MYTGSHDAKEEIRQALDIVDVVGEQIELRRKGRDFVGLCPWHDDSRPSLTVNPVRQTWKCWVCDLGGDIFSFVMEREGVEFREALKMLAERAGVALEPSKPSRPVEPGSPEDKHTLYRAMAWAGEQFRQCLLSEAAGKPGRDYLSQRQIDASSIERYQLGFVPNAWQWLIERAVGTPYSPEVLQAVGLTLQSEKSGRWFDRFRGRVLFPICDTQGRPIAIGGRILPEFADDKAAKYINSPETRLFSKSDQLYGMNLARDVVAKRREVIVMEGYTDVVIARQFGLDNAVAVLGTALGPRHIQLLKRFADRITLLLDGDAAGQRRASEILELFIANQIDLRIVTLPGNLDPCDFLLQRGLPALQESVAQAPDAWEYKMRLETRGLDPLRDTHRANQALENLLITLAKAPRGMAQGGGSQQLREHQILNRLAREFRVDEASLRRRLDEVRRKPSVTRVDRDDIPVKPAAAKPELERMERDLFELLLQQPSQVPNVLSQISVQQLMSPAGRSLHHHLADLMDQDREPNLDNLLLVIDDPAWKSLIVELDEAGQKKQTTDLNAAITEAVQRIQRHHTERSLQHQQVALEADDLSQQQQLDMLYDLLKKKQALID